MPSLELLTRQPAFPNEDLSETNTPIIEYYLREENGERAHAEALKQSLRIVHALAHEALSITGVQIDNTPAEYEAFCNGFAAFEYVSSLVNPRLINGTLAVRNTQKILITPGELADFELAERIQPWVESQPNTYGVIVDTGARRGETMKQLQARAIGAQIAYEFEKAA